MDKENLQLQFSRMQEEQHKKMARMKQKQAQKSNTSLDSSAFGVSDELGLSLNDVMGSSTVGLNTTLEAANTSMREEIRELKDETGRLRKVLAEKEYEIKKTNKKILKLEDEKKLLANAGVASDSASTKIVELSKKNRELTAIMESEKAKTFRLQQKVKDLEYSVNNAVANSGGDSKSTKPMNVRQSFANMVSSDGLTLPELEEQMSSLNLKSAEYRNQVQALKQELKVAHKVLSQEIGDERVNIQLLLNSGGQGYRGRAQQVISLQGKVKELEQRLKQDEVLSPKSDKNMTRIKNMEKLRKEQNDTLKEDLQKLQDNYSELQKKFDATKARNKVLMAEVKSQKSQVAVLSDKGVHDNELISTLMKQQERLQKILERQSLKEEDVTKSERQVTRELHDKKQQESAEVTRLKTLLSESEKKVKQLEEELSASSRRDSLEGESSYKPLSVISPPSTQDKQDTAQAAASLNDSEELTHFRARCVEYKAMYEASEIERLRLSEMVGALNSRLNDTVTKCEVLITSNHDDKRVIQRLEQRLGGKTDPHKEDTSHTSEDLQAQLLIQQDENHALKETLQSTLRHKHDDVTMYQELIQQTKQVFLDALRNFSGSK
uniref:coiled-coil domain-containing protein 13-like isoform X2 n=1 Tax=Ciona intestinalis TaxID=7719 RepID=UPI00089DB967|nr:coiled-coil domain-containing protein 13-like isoform X2 [Ciona intestinalis]|eukprot:XP_018667996.1 coiled-coil domain-containing protein 13-like isoform X2 [Ciona intestinalis]